MLTARAGRWKGRPPLWLETAEQTVPVSKLVYDGQRLAATFADQSTAVFRVTCERGFAVLQLEQFAPRSEVLRFRVFRLPMPPASEIAATLNAGPVTVLQQR